GRNAGELAKHGINHDNLVRLMVGRELKTLYPHVRPAARPEALLSVRDLRYRGGPAHPVSFDVFPGEVFGMAGLVGAGRTELAEAIFGVRRATAGEIRVGGHPVVVRKPKDAIRAGIAMVPEDRRFNGLILPEGVGFNISLPNLSRLSS